MGFSSVSIVGAGPQGCSVALACAADGLPVTLVRAARADLAHVRRRLEQRVDLGLQRGDLERGCRDEILGRIHVTADLARVAEDDLVIDVSHCDPRARRAMLATLESRLSASTVLATTVPADQLASMAEVVRRPDQLVGMRFVVGEQLDAQIEIAFLPETAPGVIAACRSFVSTLGRTPLVHADQASRVGYREWLSSSPPPPLPGGAD
jgi:3-hydroxyacyl-CoA dehydrogenase